MSVYARKTPLYFATLCFLWPLVAWSQVGSNSPGQPAAPQQHTTDSTAIPLISHGQSQDTQFLALLRARDGQFAQVGELGRIISFNDNFRAKLERQLNDDNVPSAFKPFTREQMTKAFNTAIMDLQTFEGKVKATADISAQRELARKFDDGYPVLRVERQPNTARSQTERAWMNVFDRERANLNELFQNLSIENREWRTRYETFFALLDKDIAALGDNLKPLTTLNNLPTSFADLAGIQRATSEPYQEITLEQILSAIGKYRDALQASFGEIPPQPPLLSEIRTRLVGEIDKISKALVDKSSEVNTRFSDLEKSIAGAARSLYGNKVGAESFNYLLIVFAAVFLLIMLLPRIYSDTVATNILKAEFLLQFSTVFVLIAAIIILGIGELIDKQQLPVLLAGISGYVLGQLGKT